jgi:hypothetical protein
VRLAALIERPYDLAYAIDETRVIVAEHFFLI